MKIIIGCVLLAIAFATIYRFGQVAGYRDGYDVGYLSAVIGWEYNNGKKYNKKRKKENES